VVLTRHPVCSQVDSPFELLKRHLKGSQVIFSTVDEFKEPCEDVIECYPT
jgi:hypothetical protein